jgi:hypothetical protein
LNPVTPETRQPDNEEKAIRLGCGVLFGVVVAGVALLRIVDLPWPWWVLFFAAVVAWCGYSAVKHGDEFWLDAFRNWW